MLVLCGALCTSLAAAADTGAAARALAYLESTQDEMGIDVLVVLQIYGALSADARAAGIVEARRGTISERDLELYGTLLEIEKRAFPFAAASELDLPPVKATDLAEEFDDERVRSCPIDALSCRTPAACIEFATANSWGKVLTHQAVWLLFTKWAGCDRVLDADALRRVYASRLVAEAQLDPRPSDLFFERLAVLGHLGFASAIEPQWFDALRASQQPEGCFPAGPDARCHPHPAALALWALAHEASNSRPPEP